ncbi:MAG: hypothetical protein ACR2JG_01570 [Geodermatophilaceae bacterium]
MSQRFLDQQWTDAAFAARGIETARQENAVALSACPPTAKALVPSIA